MRKITWFVLLLLAAFAISSCTPAAAPAPITPASTAVIPDTGSAPAQIVLGAALPLTGTYTNEGGAFKKAYELYQKEINAAGGVMVQKYGKKIPIKLIIYDDQSDPTISVQMYEKLATEDKVDFLLGGYATPLVEAQTVVPEKYKIPYVNGGGATGEIYTRGFKYIFGLLANISKLSDTLTRWMATQQDAGKLPKPLKIAVIGENSSHGVEFRKGFEDAAKASPDRFQIVLDEGFEINLKDADPILQKVKAANADAFVADARVADYTTLQKHYAELGLYHMVVSYGPRGTEKPARDALGPASNYIIAANWWDKGLKDPASVAFVQKYTAAYGTPPDSYFAALGYEAERTLVTAIETAGSLDREKVRTALAATNITPSLLIGGTIKFGPNGQVQNDYLITQNTPDGKAVIIYPPDLATGEAVVPYPKP